MAPKQPKIIKNILSIFLSFPRIDIYHIQEGVCIKLHTKIHNLGKPCFFVTSVDEMNRFVSESCQGVLKSHKFIMPSSLMILSGAN